MPVNDGGLSYIDNYELIVGNVQKRSSRDLTVNEYGSNLINFCKSSGYHIMNGRLNDICNTIDFMRYKENGASVADYLICKSESMNHITNFVINIKQSISDHRPLAFTFSCIINVNTEESEIRGFSKHAITGTILNLLCLRQN